MEITIVRRPEGEAPEWVRDAWIGMALPSVTDRPRAWPGLGVLSGRHDRASRLWALLSGRTFRIDGYRVNAATAVDRLADKDPRAAGWWREQAPHMLDGRRRFVFDIAACEPAP